MKVVLNASNLSRLYSSANIHQIGDVSRRHASLCDVLGTLKLELVVETKHLFVDQFNLAPLTSEQIDKIIAVIHDDSTDLAWRFKCFREGEYDSSGFNDLLEGPGLRVMNAAVDQVIDDARIGVFKCAYCGDQMQEDEHKDHPCDIKYIKKLMRGPND